MHAGYQSHVIDMITDMFNLYSPPIKHVKTFKGSFRGMNSPGVSGSNEGAGWVLGVK